MKFIYTILLIIFVVIAVVFAISNSENVIVDYYWGTNNMPLSLALSISLVLGCLLGILASLKSILSAKYEIRSLKKEVKTANKEIANLRSIPIKDEH